MFSKKSGMHPAVQIVAAVFGVLLFLASLAALAGIYYTHMVGGGATFGTTTASLSIIAFSVSIYVLHSCLCCPNCGISK
jgi:hypothetical protein